MEQKSQEEKRLELEAELAANELADRTHRRRTITTLVVIFVLIIAAVSAYLAFRPNEEPEVYYSNGDIDYVKQADKLRRTSGFKEVYEFRGGYSIVSNGKKYGVVDVKGNVICPVKYDEITSNYSEHYPELCEVNLNGKYGLVNKKGQETVKPIYDEIGPISNGTMEVTLGKENFYIDTNGKRIN